MQEDRRHSSNHVVFCKFLHNIDLHLNAVVMKLTPQAHGAHCNADRPTSKIQAIDDKHVVSHCNGRNASKCSIHEAHPLSEHHGRNMINKRQAWPAGILSHEYFLAA